MASEGHPHPVRVTRGVDLEGLQDFEITQFTAPLEEFIPGVGGDVDIDEDDVIRPVEQLLN
jgi:hypothetical protein